MSLDGLKVVFMGTPIFSLPSLKALIGAGCDILAVVTQPDRPKGRSRKLVAPPVKELALAEGLKVFQPGRVRDEEFIDRVKELAPDLIVVVAFGQILPKTLLEIPPLGCINVHASLLPSYRGAAPINWAIVNGEKVSGVTTMLMDEGLDTGDMLLKSELPIKDDDDSQSLYGALSCEGGKLLIKTMAGLKDNSVKPVKQNDADASYAPIIKKEDGLIEWSKDASEIVNLVRGMLPWPVAYTKVKGSTLKIFGAEARHECGRPGSVINVGKDSFDVAAGEGSLRVYDLQLEGKRRMKTGDFLKGFNLEVGEAVGS